MSCLCIDTNGRLCVVGIHAADVINYCKGGKKAVVCLVVTKGAVYDGEGDVPTGRVVVVPETRHHLVIGTVEFWSKTSNDVISADRIEELEEMLLCDTPLRAQI